MSVKCTRRTLRMPSFTRATHAQPSLSNFPRRGSDFGERTRSRGTTRLEQNFPTAPQNKKTKLTHLIQFPPEMDENWVRFGLAKLGQISRLPNWQRMLFCAYTTQLLHSTGEGCWNNKDSYFIWFKFVC